MEKGQGWESNAAALPILSCLGTAIASPSGPVRKPAFEKIHRIDNDPTAWKGIREETMPQITETLIFWIILATQVAGISSVVVARLSEGSWGAAASRRVFFACLLAVALATVSAIQLHAACWLIGAATLGLMAVGATLDFGTSRHTAAEF
jgi:hypothetical protein